jgi:Tol biopolymer transport system component
MRTLMTVFLCALISAIIVQHDIILPSTVGAAAADVVFEVQRAEQLIPKWLQAAADPYVRVAAATASDPTGTGPTISSPTPIKLAKIPPNAEVVFHQDGYIYTMDGNGQNVAQITFEKAEYAWEHAAISPDRRFIVGNEPLPRSTGGRPGVWSRVWLFDLEKGTKAQLLPQWVMVGNGGVDWDHKGFIYFAAKEKFVVANPKRLSDMLAEAGAHDVYKIKVDGTGLTRLTNTPDRAEADVSVSQDGTLVTGVSQVVGPDDSSRDLTEIWIINSDGTNPRVVHRGGKVGVSSVHDPELSPDNSKVAFSMVNSNVPPNFRKISGANTAHDICTINVDGTGFTRLTKPGPISIIPNWRNNLIMYFEGNERDKYIGAAVVTDNSTDQTPRRIKAGANSPKWIASKK